MVNRMKYAKMNAIIAKSDQDDVYGNYKKEACFETAMCYSSCASFMGTLREIAGVQLCGY